jgi:hypothetical protein
MGLVKKILNGVENLSLDNVFTLFHNAKKTLGYDFKTH